MKWWRHLSIARKLYFVVGIMAVLITGELLTLRFAMRKLSAVRAFVGGEGLWSKAQKNAILSLERFALTHREEDYQAYLAHLQIPEGDHRAREELLKAHPDMAIVFSGFREGHIDADDIGPMVELLRGFYWVSYLSRAIGVWTEGDRLLAQLKVAAGRYHDMVLAGSRDTLALDSALAQVMALNDKLTTVEEDFSNALGEGSRWLERLVITLLFFAVLTVESVGLTLTFMTSRRISDGLDAINKAAGRIGRNDFSKPLEVHSEDEIGELSESVNKMGLLLERSYRELEVRVQERTAELEKAVAENARLYEEAKAAVQSRDEFFSIASHELKTPLTSLHLRLELLSRSIEGQSKTVLESCLRQSRRLATLSDELMDLTRLRLGKLEIKRERADLSAIVCDAVSQLSADAARAGAEIHIHSDGPLFGEFDSLRVGQIATNLISNAIKYGKGKPIEVTIKSGLDNLLLVVKDQGKGIAPEEQARVFDRFERVATESSISGLGLGLYITRQIVHAHGGSISVQSQKDQGAIFTVAFPAA